MNIRTHILVEEELWSWVRERAAAENRTVSKQVETMLRGVRDSLEASGSRLAAGRWMGRSQRERR